jgi:MoxR-like ATPase
MIIGQEELFQRLMIGLLTSGHILLEGVPGLAKTRAIQVISKTVNAVFHRIQFTPDLLPSDIIGNQIFNPKEGSYFTKKGPVFANFLLADEINRSPAKVQSALLEAMQERQVTIGNETYKLPEFFYVLATQNPIEQEGTYQLPEAQLDRFLLKTIIKYPTPQEELQMLDMLEKETYANVSQIASGLQVTDIATMQEITKHVYLEAKVKEYIINIVAATRRPQDYAIKLDNVISFGGSPRASIAFMKAGKALALLAGRDYVTPDDIKAIAKDVLRHRVILSYEAEATGNTVENVIEKILNGIRVP